MKRLNGVWNEEFIENSDGFSYECGFCNSKVSPTDILKCKIQQMEFGKVLICTSCNRPTYFEELCSIQIPNKMYGMNVQHLTEDIFSIYNEAKLCYSSNAYTATSLICRKILMNVAVDQGAKEDDSFVSYVNYLDNEGYIPPNGKDWVDAIRKHGNDATHKIPSITNEDAMNIIDFTGLLLTFIYEMPGKLKNN